MLISILAGLGAAVGWGLGDFSSKKVVDRMGALPALLPVQTAAVLFGCLLLAVFGLSPFIPPEPQLYLAAGSLIFGVSGLMFYVALSVGSVSIIVAVYGLCTVVPFLWEVFYAGLALTPWTILAAAFLVTSGILVSLDFAEIRRTRRGKLGKGIPQILVSVVTAGAALILIDRGVDSVGWVRGYFHMQFFQWVLFVVLVRLILRRGSFAPPRAVRGWFAAAATAYFVAFVSLQLGMQYASVGIVSLVGSLAAGVTAVTAWRLGHERLHPGQYFGIALGIVGLMLLSL